MNRNHQRRRPQGDSGYALLMVIFLVGLMTIAAALAAPLLVTQGRREKEDELIWRGEQHVRGIRLYYRKLGHFPKSLDDLTKAQNGIHFLRKPYKDPMNSDKGEFRLIYVGSAGQLMGSVTRTSLTLTGLQQPGQLGAGANKPAGAAPNLPVPQPPATNLVGDQNPEPDEEGGDATNPLPAPIAAPKSGVTTGVGPLQGQVFGGNLIGVASKVDRKSVKFYKGYGKYKEWEFIWDPQAEAAAAAGAQLNTPGGARTPQQSLFPNPQPQPSPTSQPPQ